MRILGSGNVGIGRVDPLYKFNVDNGSTAGVTALFQASSLGSGVKSSIIIGKTNTNNNSGTIVWNHQADADATNYLGLGCWNSDNTLNITAAGRVGIGTTNPQNTLHLTQGSTANFSNVFFVNPNSDTDSRSFFMQGATSSNPVGTSGIGTSRVTIQDRSNYYIHFASFNGTTAFTTTGYIYLNAGNVQLSPTSDYRIKSNVTPLTSGLQTINSLKPVTFTYNIYPNIVHRGFIAHEVQEFIPLAVNGQKDALNEDGSINAQGLDKTYMIPYLVGAIQELSAKNADLESRLAALEAKLA